MIILAAGSSSRLGQPKQLLDYGGKNLLQHIIEVAEHSVAAHVLVVLGAHHDLISGQIRPGPGTQVLINQEWQEGIASSIRTALQFLAQQYPSVTGALFMVCDQPFISTELLNRLMAVQKQTGKPIVASSYENTIGTPVLFLKEMFSELLQLKADAGAKKILLRHPEETATVPFPLGAVDIDTEAAYAAFKNRGEN